MKKPKTTTTQAPSLETQPQPKKMTTAEKVQTLLATSSDLREFMRLEASLVGDHYNAMLPPAQALSNLMGLTNALCTRMGAYLDSVSKILEPREGRETAVEPIIVEQQRWAAGMRIQSLMPSYAMALAARDRLSVEYKELHPPDLSDDPPFEAAKPLDRQAWTQEVVDVKGKTALPAAHVEPTHAQKTKPGTSAGSRSKKPI